MCLLLEIHVLKQRQCLWGIRTTRMYSTYDGGGCVEVPCSACHPCLVESPACPVVKIYPNKFADISRPIAGATVGRSILILPGTSAVTSLVAESRRLFFSALK